MIEPVIQNRIKAKESRENGIKTYPSEEVLGSLKAVRDFAAFGIKFKKELDIIKATMLLEYCEDQSFTPQELKSFKLGLEAYAKFFDNAEADVKSYIQESEQANTRKSVG